MRQRALVNVNAAQKIAIAIPPVPIILMVPERRDEQEVARCWFAKCRTSSIVGLSHGAQRRQVKPRRAGRLKCPGAVEMTRCSDDDFGCGHTRPNNFEAERKDNRPGIGHARQRGGLATRHTAGFGDRASVGNRRIGC